MKPLMVKGKLSSVVERGKDLLFSEALGCADGREGPFYTDRKFHDVGAVGKSDKLTDRFDTPSLIVIWRSTPYLHNSSAATVRDCSPRKIPRIGTAMSGS